MPIVLIVFAKPGCPACEMHRQALEHTRRRFPDVTLIVAEQGRKVNNAVLDAWGINMFPTSVIVDPTIGDEGQEVRRWEGTLTPKQLAEVFIIARRIEPYVPSSHEADFSDGDEE
jgi:glutaredoxin